MLVYRVEGMDWFGEIVVGRERTITHGGDEIYSL